MRTKVIAGNWKMNKLPSETYDFIKEIENSTKGANCTVVCCTPYVCLTEAVKAAKDTHVKIGAENLHFEDKGAFTGEVSADMLKDIGVEYVIIGHSERRQYFAETDETVNLKTKKALENGLVPIVCVGESLEEREAGITMDIISIQIKKAFADINADDAKSGQLAQVKLLLLTKLRKYVKALEIFSVSFTALTAHRNLLFSMAAA